MLRKPGIVVWTLIIVMLLLSSGLVMLGTNTVTAVQDGDYTYSVDNGVATITGYTGASTTITIPSTLGGYNVVAIGDNAFTSSNSLTSVNIPSGVASIGNQTFAARVGFVLWSYPVEGPFITSINVDPGNANYASVDGVLYNKDITTLIRWPVAKDGAVSIPATVKKMGDYSFAECTALISVTIPAGVTTIGNHTFEYSYLTSVTISDTVTTVGNSAFYCCQHLVNVTLGDSVRTIGDDAFAECSRLTAMTFPASVTHIGDGVFIGFTGNLRSVTFLGLVAPYTGPTCFTSDYASRLGHAYRGSNFPTVGNMYNGLMMGDALDPLVPSTPTGMTALAGKAQVSLNWTAPASNGGATIDYYDIYQDGVALPNHPTGLTTVIIGLTNGQSYSFTVKAHNSAGEGNQSGSVSSTPRSVPDAITGLTATPSDGQVVLNWTAPANDGGHPIDYYIVYQDNVDVLHTTSAVLTATITDLTNGRSYSFVVIAHNVLGESILSGTSSTPCLVPNAPTELNTVAGNAQISLSWAAPTFDGGGAIDYYVIYQDGVALPELATGGTTTITGLTNGQSYSFTVAAHNGAGQGANSTPILATPCTTSLTVESISSTSTMGISNDLLGNITAQIGGKTVSISGVNITLAYSIDNGQSWVALPFVTSSSDGSFSRSWIPSATGVYLIKAEWVGNSQYPAAQSTFSIAVTTSSGNDVFTVQSNSTISDLSFNSTSKELSFTVNGTSGTSGYTRISISKDLVTNGNDIRITIDGAGMNYTLTSSNTSWILYFTYHHSTHQVVADLDSKGTTSTASDNTFIIVLAAICALSIIGVGLFVEKKRNGKV